MISPPPETLTLHPDDNVAMAVSHLLRRGRLLAEDGPVFLPGPISSGHKFARRAIAAGELVLKYGQPIGRAVTSIALGEHVHVHNVESLRGRGDLGPRLAATPLLRPGPVTPYAETPSGDPAAEVSFLATPARRASRRPNHLLVLAAVGCADGVVNRIGRALPELSPSLTSMAAPSSERTGQTQRVLEGFAAPSQRGRRIAGRPGMRDHSDCRDGAEAGLARRALPAPDHPGGGREPGDLRPRRALAASCWTRFRVSGGNRRPSRS